jgi:hypothetical protein
VVPFLYRAREGAPTKKMLRSRWWEGPPGPESESRPGGRSHHEDAPVTLVGGTSWSRLRIAPGRVLPPGNSPSSVEAPTSVERAPSRDESRPRSPAFAVQRLWPLAAAPTAEKGELSISIE